MASEYISCRPWFLLLQRCSRFRHSVMYNVMYMSTRSTSDCVRGERRYEIKLLPDEMCVIAQQITLYLNLVRAKEDVRLEVVQWLINHVLLQRRHNRGRSAAVRPQRQNGHVAHRAVVLANVRVVCLGTIEVVGLSFTIRMNHTAWVMRLVARHTPWCEYCPRDKQPIGCPSSRPHKNHGQSSSTYRHRWSFLVRLRMAYKCNFALN